MDIFAALRSRNRSAGHLCALRVELSVAYANRAMALLWSLLWAVLLFGEQITVKKLIGVGLVLAGTLIINGGKEQENHD